MRRPVILGFVLAALTGCAETPPPRLGPVATGPGEWRITAHARDIGAARLRGLREAAALTLAQGGDWFRVRGRDFADPNSDGPNIGAFDDFSTPDHERRSGLSLDIEIGHGPRPEGPTVYDAHAVASQLGGDRPAPQNLMRT